MFPAMLVRVYRAAEGLSASVWWHTGLNKGSWFLGFLCGFFPGNIIFAEILVLVHNHITNFIDFFYRPFKRVMPLQTFRYAACGGGNTLLGLAVYSLGLKFLFHEENFTLLGQTFKGHNAALFLSFLVSFPVGMFLMKYVVFVESSLRGRVQLFRYFVVFVSNLFLNYLLLNLMSNKLHWNAYVSQVIAIIITVVTSYVLQRHYSFRTDKNAANIEP